MLDIFKAIPYLCQRKERKQTKLNKKKYKAMTQQEFETLTGKKIDADVYRSIVEPAYMASSFSDKQKFAIAWDTTGHFGIINDLTKQADSYDAALRQMSKERRDMGYYLADQAEKCSSSDLREKAIEILGEKEYIRYKISKPYNLWDADRELLLSII